MLPLLPEISDAKSLRDPIRTIIAEPAKGRKKAIAPQFDTVLAMEEKGAKPFQDAEDPLKGMLYVEFQV